MFGQNDFQQMNFDFMNQVYDPAFVELQDEVNFGEQEESSSAKDFEEEVKE
jgi:hypothetical protein